MNGFQKGFDILCRIDSIQCCIRGHRQHKNFEENFIIINPVETNRDKNGPRDDKHS
jgi:hypothetical protein